MYDILIVDHTLIRPSITIHKHFCGDCGRGGEGNGTCLKRLAPSRRELEMGLINLVISHAPQVNGRIFSAASLYCVLNRTYIVFAKRLWGGNGCGSACNGGCLGRLIQTVA